MTDLRRRAILALGSAAALAPAALRAQAAAPPAATAAADPWRQPWDNARVLPLWDRVPPGHGQFAGAAPPPDAPWFFVRNIAAPQLRVFLPPRPNGRGVLVIPGGGYEFVSVGNEGVDIAARFNDLGYAAFVLTYRLPGEGWHDAYAVPLQDAQRAVRVLRSRAAEFGVDAERLACVGFSAGGHLAATLATAHARRVYTPVDEVDQLSARPFAAGLVYPVISMALPMTHGGSRLHLLGPTPTDARVAAWSAERLVGATTSLCFLAHACDDDAVPVENSLEFLAAMRRAARPVEAHLFQEGRHAFGVGRPDTPSADWIGLYATWLRRL
jgi:acetyl esterase/lipase